jgi:hypothetical protein
MTDQILKTSEQWQSEQYQTYTVVDPDGWDRRNFQFSFYEELISEQEFMKRLLSSSLIIGPKATRYTFSQTP